MVRDGQASLDFRIGLPAAARKSGGSGARLIVATAAVLALFTFAVYAPSLASGLVYDAPLEIVQEGFVTSLANLPAVLTLKVLGMPVILASRPGQILYLMLIASISGKAPSGYHLGSNLLHAINVALLFLFLQRLLKTEPAAPTREDRLKSRLAAIVVTLIFALHPLAVETVANVSYSSDLLVFFFTLLALLAATAFDPAAGRGAVGWAVVGVLCSFAAVSCKESGTSAAALLFAYWFIFRWREPRGPWLVFLGAALAVTTAFLVARFVLAPPPFSPDPLQYLGGSPAQVFWIQPRLWVFMLGKIFWPVGLSADYTLDDLRGLTFFPAIVVLLVVVVLQVLLARTSRLGAFGVAIFWIGLATVSNILPLFCIEADRYYYLPMAGVALQLLALLRRVRATGLFWATLGVLLLALPPLLVATLNREPVFASDVALWSDTIRVNPLCLRAYRNLGVGYYNERLFDQAIVADEKALALDPSYLDAHFNLGINFAQEGRGREAIEQFRQVLRLRPGFVGAHLNLGIVLLEEGRLSEAAAEFREALRLEPGNANIQSLLRRATAPAMGTGSK
jgi:hypothetical protein